MSYAVKEIFYSLQGEGVRAGRPAVFLRFAGCNLWSGRESDRAKAVCRFCDTDFVGGERFPDAAALAAVVAEHWPASAERHRYVVCTGGEPLLQLDEPLAAALRGCGFEVAVETNGTVAPAAGIDWLCVSPKASSALKVTAGDELKLVYPQPGLDPAELAALPFRHFLLQPMDGPDLAANTEAAVRYCLENPLWRLSLQTHKLLGIR